MCDFSSLVLRFIDIERDNILSEGLKGKFVFGDEVLATVVSFSPTVKERTSIDWYPIVDDSYT